MPNKSRCIFLCGSGNNIYTYDCWTTYNGLIVLRFSSPCHSPCTQCRPSHCCEALKRTRFPVIHPQHMHGACNNARSSSKGNYANEMSICSSVLLSKHAGRSVARWVATRPTSHDAHQRFQPSEGILYSASWFRPARV